jgi:hypothetical protein
VNTKSGKERRGETILATHPPTEKKKKKRKSCLRKMKSVEELKTKSEDVEEPRPPSRSPDSPSVT